MQLSDPFQTQLVSGVSKMQKLPQIHHQQHGRPVGSRIVSVVPQPKSEIEDSKNVGGSPQWVAGPATMTPPRVHPEPMQPFHREESMGHEKTKISVSQNDYSTESEAQINNDPLARRNPMTRINVDMLSNVLPNQSSPIREQVAIHGTRDGSVWSGRGPVRPAKQRLAQANLVYEYEA
ncbi:hypothetical protein AHF37_08386 [Paragonimus kellicotti]|nr:hypothetical protein AHF37_08386 [Paragonimus kellicotti]